MVAVLVVLLSSIWVAKATADAGVIRPPRRHTVVYITVGTGFADALGDWTRSWRQRRSIIIVPTNPPFDAATIAELIRLDPRTVIIVGGLAVVSQSTENGIAALLPYAVITRIAGPNRYVTNAMFSAATFPIEGWAAISSAGFTGLSPAVEAVSINTGASNATTTLLYGSIQLPHGAQILELKAMGADSGADTLTVILYRVSTSQETLATTSSIGSPGYTSFSTTAIAAGKETVDNENFSYQIYVTGADGNPFINNVMVRYRLGASNG
jgi:hypothetical protein